MKIHTKASAAALAAATAILAAGCGSSGSTGPAASSAQPASPSGGGSAPATGPTATATATAQGGSAASPSSPGGGQARGPGRCHTSMLSAHVTMGSPGAGQRYAFLVLTNGASVTCRVLGYPGLQLANASGPIVTDVVRVAATPQLLSVTPGQHVYSLLHWTVVPAANETPTPCEPVPTVIRVIPPDETAALSTSWPGGSVCQHGMIDVSPFKPGTGS